MPPKNKRGFTEQILRDVSVSRHHESSAADAMERLMAHSQVKTANQEKVQPIQSMREYRP